MSEKHKFQASEATRESILLRAAFCGPTGSGKTKTGLILGTRMVERLQTGPLFVIDSENRSALRYAYSPRSRQGYRFKHVEMPQDDYSPQAYIDALEYCESQGAGVVLIDSLSHAWAGINGVLEQVDKITDQSRSKAAFSTGWKDMTPKQNRMIQRICGSSAHVIWTMRAKVDWVIQENERGKKEPIKVGLAPVQREGVDYEPDLFFDMTVPNNDLIVSKSRCDRLAPGETFKKPGLDFADVIIEWIQDAEPAVGARSLGEALSIAVMAGIAAVEAGDEAAKKAAVAGLMSWCREHGISEARYEATKAQMGERVREATTKAKPTAA